jgi:uncharacterized protein
LLIIFVDADACPVKSEVYRVAQRFGLKVVLVANSMITCPTEEWIKLKVVGNALDAADNWILEQVSRDDIIVTSDIPLASLGFKKGARIISPKGLVFTESSLCNAVATRDLMTHLRDTGLTTSGPPAFSKKDRSNFLHALDNLIRTIQSGK